jgi:hypothetical protein
MNCAQFSKIKHIRGGGWRESGRGGVVGVVVTHPMPDPFGTAIGCKVRYWGLRHCQEGIGRPPDFRPEQRPGAHCRTRHLGPSASFTLFNEYARTLDVWIRAMIEKKFNYFQTPM